MSSDFPRHRDRWENTHLPYPEASGRFSQLRNPVLRHKVRSPRPDIKSGRRSRTFVVGSRDTNSYSDHRSRTVGREALSYLGPRFHVGDTVDSDKCWVKHCIYGQSPQSVALLASNFNKNKLSAKASTLLIRLPKFPKLRKSLQPQRLVLPEVLSLG